MEKLLASETGGGDASGDGGSAEAEGEAEDEALPQWMPVRFDASTAKEDHGIAEREMITYCGSTQVRWGVKEARERWAALNEREEGAPAPPPLYGVSTSIGGPVFRHVTVKDDMDIVALAEETVRSLRF
jgi:hypothetical protein